MSISVRRATEADAPEMSRVLIASITELCSADHHDDPAAIAAWTANKSVEGVLAMLAAPDSEIYVADRQGTIVAVGAIHADMIELNYVDPQHRRRGVSRAVMLRLEGVLRDRGVAVARLKSTETAHDFYKALGWSDAGPAARGRFIAAYPMRKALISR